MERKITNLEHSHVEVAVVVDNAAWKAAQEKAFNKLAANVQVQGFRKGKAPANLVKSKVDPMKVMDDAINALLPVIYRDIIEVDGVRPVAQPKVDVTKLSPEELEVKFILVVAPEVKLGAYKGLEIGHEKVEVKDTDVETAVYAALTQNATLVVKDGAAEKGDIVVMDFVGTVDGVVFDGGSAQNHELELGSNTFIPGFEDQLIGAKAGDHVDVKVTFPTQYVESLAGKDAVFACDVHEVKTKKMPELNDEFVKELKMEGVETVEAYKAAKKVELEKNAENDENNRYLGKLLETIVKGAEIDMPTEIIDGQTAYRKEDFVKRMEQSGLTLEQYLQYVGQKEEDLDAQLRAQAEGEVRTTMVLEKIAEVENIVITDADVDAEMEKIAAQYNMKLEDVKKALAPQMAEYKNEIRMQRVRTLLASENK